MHLPPPIIAKPLPYESQLTQRKPTDIDLVVIHCTELPDLATAREYGERVLYDNGTGNSGHYYIDRDGSIQQYVALDRVAHHVRGINPRSIGIELVNRGRWPNWFDADKQTMSEPYPEAQIASLVRLLEWLPQALPSLRFIAGHEQLDTALEPASDDPSRSVQRKLDPGPLFPWELVLRAVDLQRLPD
ncbi:N-acetylmuramoyl-L-alanine amidase [Stenotrophomonas sp.]|uniref:N-acetylmuramoyl-L-alanine amidase n=1 Tax=Stenotrophomonas sp. TaxID=69392 RepID=UPI0028A75415|nr:N-acetylmuramoyl-L-alanine amidase [Stenotrophomonas sp.]